MAAENGSSAKLVMFQCGFDENTSGLTSTTENTAVVQRSGSACLGVRGLRSMKKAYAEQVKACPIVHLTLDHPEAVDMSFCLPVAPW